MSTAAVSYVREMLQRCVVSFKGSLCTSIKEGVLGAVHSWYIHCLDNTRTGTVARKDSVTIMSTRKLQQLPSIILVTQKSTPDFSALFHICDSVHAPQTPNSSRLASTGLQA